MRLLLPSFIPLFVYGVLPQGFQPFLSFYQIHMFTKNWKHHCGIYEATAFDLGTPLGRIPVRGYHRGANLS